MTGSDATEDRGEGSSTLASVYEYSVSRSIVLINRISLRSFLPMGASRLPSSRITKNRICWPLEMRVWHLVSGLALR